MLSLQTRNITMSWKEFGNSQLLSNGRDADDNFVEDVVVLFEGTEWGILN